MNSKFKYRVLEDRGTSFVVRNEEGLILPAELSGRMRLLDPLLWPTTGDGVDGELQPGGWLYIDFVAERTNLLLRQNGKAAQRLGANIDFLFIATAAEKDFNLNRLDRYVAMAYNFGITPVILITKIELCDDPTSLLQETSERFPFVDIHAISVVSDMNLDALDRYLKPETTIAIMGSSGVGKSTLINRLLNSEVLETGAIREDDGKGRHTTTGRSLHLTDSGVWLMDTPGIRSLSLWDGEEGLETLFEDIETLSRQCKFTDCRHENEPRCRIRESLESGELDEARWNSYLKLQAESAFERRKTDKAEASKQRDAWKKISKSIRQKAKLEGR